jgi:hypothetical protein
LLLLLLLDWMMRRAVVVVVSSTTEGNNFHVHQGSQERQDGQLRGCTAVIVLRLTSGTSRWSRC